ncbi:MAG: putative hydro-lyase [Thermodesulfobacteriota bacterium]
MDKEAVRKLQPREIRSLIRKREFTGSTEGCAEDYAQANLVVLPARNAFDFLLFCQRNPKPCPILEVTEPGVSVLRDLAEGADIRTDLPRYRVYEKGECVAEPEDIGAYWRDDLVAFLIGCSYSFESALLKARIRLPHIELGEIVSVYITKVPCQPAGIFHGPLATSMRPIKRDQVIRAVQITSRFPGVHGAPVHIGDPAPLGLADLSRPDFGWVPQFAEDEVPVFWGCGVTPQAVAMKAKVDFMITHYPGHMFITDRLSEEFAVI